MTSPAKKLSPLRERQQQRVRSDLIAATLRIVSVDDPATATIDRIAAEAGMSRATLYAHYPDGRDTLLRAAYDHVGTQLLERARHSAADLSTWDERIVAYARAMLELSTDPRSGYFFNITGPALVGFRPERGTGSQGFFTDFCAYLDEARDLHEIDDATDIKATATLLSGSLRDAGIETSRHPERAAGFIEAFRRLVAGIRTAPRK